MKFLNLPQSKIIFTHICVQFTLTLLISKVFSVSVTNLLLLNSLATILISYIFLMAIKTWFINPIEHIIDVVSCVESGDCKAQISSNDMEGTARILADHINTMICRLQETLNDLEEEKNLLYTLIDVIPYPIFMKDIQGRYIKVNNRMLEDLGFENRSEIIDKQSKDLFSDRIVIESINREFDQVIRGTKIINQQHLIRRDGSPMWVNTTKIPFYDEDGMVAGMVGISRDITDLKLIETDLLDSRESLENSLKKIKKERVLLDTLIDTIPDPIFMKDMERRYINVNKSFVRNLGFSDPNEIIGKRSEDIINDPKIIELYNLEFDQIISGNPVFNRMQKLELYRHDGTPFWASITKVRFYDKDGAIAGIVGISRDVSELKQKESELQESERMMQNILDTIPVRVFWKDINCRFQGANQLFLQDAGLNNINEIIGKTDSELFPEEADLYMVDDLAVMESGESRINYEESQTTSMGDVIWLQTSKIPLRDNNGKIKGILGAYTDITSRKKLEVSLQEREALYRMLAEYSTDIISRNNPDGSLSYVSPAIESIWGYKPSELLGSSIANLIHQDDLADVISMYESILKSSTNTNEIKRVAYRAWHKDGQLIWLESSGQAVYDPETNKVEYVIGIHRDVTKQKNVEEALRDSEARFSAVFDQSNGLQLICSVEANGTFCIVDVNQHYIAVATSNGFDITEKKLIGKQLEDVIINVFGFDETILHNVVQHYQQAVESGASVRYEEKLPTPKGTHYFDSTAVPIFDPSGTCRYILYNGRDITEHKHSELRIRELLLESEQQTHHYRALFEQSRDAILILDINGHYLDCNSAAQKMLGYTRDELIGQHRTIVTPPEELENAREIETRLHQNDHVFLYERMLRRKDGSLFPTEVSASIIQDIDRDQGPFIQAIIRDITERKRAEQAILDNQRLLQAILDTIPDIIYIHDIEHYKDVFYTRHIGEDLGYSIEEISELGDEFLEALIHEDDYTILPKHSEKIQSLKDREILECEYRIHHKNGIWRWISMRDVVFVRNDVGAPAKLLRVIQDITESKIFVRKLATLINELEQKNAELERFTYTVSHDLKSPLITIKSFLDLLKIDLVSANQELINKDLAFMESAANQMERLLGDLLELSRIGRIANPSEVIQLDVLISETIKLVRGQIDKRGVTIHVADSLPDVVGDRLRILEVFQNLISNAVQYMGEQQDPQIWIGASEGESSQQVICYVRDNGIGIEVRHQKIIFGLFERLNNDEGTGIGLALVKRIVDLHDGKIWVESKGINKGSTFYFTLTKS